MISCKNLRAKFIDKLFSQYKTIKKAFSELNKDRNGYIEFNDFYYVFKSWGFEASDDAIKELFAWLDQDKDNRISFEDLR